MDSARLDLRSIRHVAFDMDGTIYLGDRLFECTPRLLAVLRSLGIGYSFITNKSSHNRSEYLHRLGSMGLSVSPEQIYTSTHATAEYLQAHLPAARRLFILGTAGMRREMSELGFEEIGDGERDGPPDAVVVGFDRTLEYVRLCRAAWWIKQGKPFIATHPDKLCPTDQPTLLVDCGALCAALHWATGQSPLVIGKPNPRMLAGLCLHNGLRPGQLAMVGDRLATDIALACGSGALGVLVLTGEATRGDVETSPWRPELIVQDLDELAALFLEAHASDAHSPGGAGGRAGTNEKGYSSHEVVASANP
jgi:NagD protein